jgi:hypothetical protein
MIRGLANGTLIGITGFTVGTVVGAMVIGAFLNSEARYGILESANPELGKEARTGHLFYEMKNSGCLDKEADE